ncbi:MAG: pentapeptide repeat-containing protein [Lentisphaeria bacterium]|nr:pentapeptide repeat-containing protein [Lentisphaeria bacterium]
MGYHRTCNYWEPTYDGKTSRQDLATFNWSNLFTGSGPYKDICDWSKYQGDHKLISDKKFHVCDFVGDLSNITFKDCEFKSCFWNRYQWRKIKFQNCRFESSSFSFANFIECQFIACSFCNIGLSGNETTFVDCIIDSQKLIASAYTNTDVRTLEVHCKTPFMQRARLSKTKSEIAQKLYRLNNRFSEYYYSSIKVAVLQEIKARILMRFYDNTLIKWFYNPFLLIFTVVDVVELVTMYVSGEIFGWGESFF